MIILYHICCITIIIRRRKKFPAIKCLSSSSYVVNPAWAGEMLFSRKVWYASEIQVRRRGGRGESRPISFLTLLRNSLGHWREVPRRMPRSDFVLFLLLSPCISFSPSRNLYLHLPDPFHATHGHTSRYFTTSRDDDCFFFFSFFFFFFFLLFFLLFLLLLLFFFFLSSRSMSSLSCIVGERVRK